MTPQLDLGLPAATNPVNRATLTPKRRAVLQYLDKNSTITTAQATHLVGGNVYANADKHTGRLLAVMVSRGLIIRQKPGVYCLPT